MTAHAPRLQYAPSPRAHPRLRSLPDPQYMLTERQWQALALVAAGRSSEEIAERLGIAADTVRRHLSNVYRSFGAKNAAQAVHIAHREGVFAFFEGRRPR